MMMFNEHFPKCGSWRRFYEGSTLDRIGPALAVVGIFVAYLVMGTLEAL